jgi:hypothetical protein
MVESQRSFNASNPAFRVSPIPSGVSLTTL